MKKLFALPGFCCFATLAILLHACNNPSPTENDPKVEKITGITETNAAGEFVGSIDTTDWSADSYTDIGFGAGYWIAPKNKLQLRSPATGTVSNQVKIFNSSDSKLSVRTKITGGFACNSPNFDLPGGELQVITVSIFLQDTMHTNYGALMIYTSPKDSVQINLEVKYNRSCEPEPVATQQSIAFFPASPNPATDSIRFKFSNNTKLNKPVSAIKIMDSTNKTIKTIGATVLVSGLFSISWDLKDENDKLIRTGLYRAKLFYGDETIQGDIQIKY